MPAVEIYPNVYWVGVVDQKIKTFHGHTYETTRGTTYNAYLIMDEKITLIDTVYGPFAHEMISRIKTIVDPSKIDYIIANHVETDHSGALPEILKFCPKAKVYGSAKCKEGLAKHYFGNWDFQIVKTGDKISLGKKTITFIEAPMVHWPDSMFSYLVEDALLLPNDAFGQHYATSKRFDDEVNQDELMEEAEKYYANILWPLSSIIARKLQEVAKMNLPIKMIAPSHGVIWRTNPNKIIEAYAHWSQNQTQPKAVIVYETMWGVTEKMAHAIAKGIREAGATVELFDITQSLRSNVVTAMFGAKGYLFGSSTHDNDMLPTIAGFLHFVKGLKPKNRIAGVFGSYGWSGGAVKSIAEILKQAGITVTDDSVSVKYVPSEAELAQCYEFGKKFAEKISKGG